MNSEIKVEQIKKLRDATGAGIMNCRKALEESKGNIEEAAEYIKKKGLLKRSSIAGRTCEAGYIGLYESAHHISCIEVLAETDFVSKSDKFRDACKSMAKFILENPEYQQKDKLSISDFDKDKDICNNLLSMGENMVVGRSKIFDKSSGPVYHYIHNNPNSPSNIYFAVVQLSQHHNNGDLIAVHFATDMSGGNELDMNATFDESNKTIKDELGNCKIIDIIKGKVGVI